MRTLAKAQPGRRREPLIFLAVDGDWVRVGRSLDVTQRITALRGTEAPNLLLQRAFPGGEKWERLLHGALVPWRSPTRSGWYSLVPEIEELFGLPEDDFRGWVLAQRDRAADVARRRRSSVAWSGRDSVIQIAGHGHVTTF